MQYTQVTILGHRVQVASSEASGLLAKAEELQCPAAHQAENIVRFVPCAGAL